MPILVQRVRDPGSFGASYTQPGPWLRIVLQEGYKREVREMCKQAGLRLLRLIRVRVGPLRLGPLPQGEFRYLAPEELAALKEASGIALKAPL